MAVAAVVCGCLYRWVLSSVVIVVPGVGDDGGGGGGGLNFSRVHGFTYVSHYTGPRLSRRLGGLYERSRSTDANSGHLIHLLFSHRPCLLAYPVCRRSRRGPLHAEALRVFTRSSWPKFALRSILTRRSTARPILVCVCACFVERMQRIAAALPSSSRT